MRERRSDPEAKADWSRARWVLFAIASALALIVGVLQAFHAG